MSGFLGVARPTLALLPLIGDQLSRYSPRSWPAPCSPPYGTSKRAVAQDKRAAAKRARVRRARKLGQV